MIGKVLIPLAKSVHHARSEVLDQDIGSLDELAGRRQVGSVLQIQGQPTLVSVEMGVGRHRLLGPNRAICINDVSARIGK